MPTLAELQAQIAELTQQAEVLHKRESAEALATVKELVAKYGLTAEQIGVSRASPARTAGKVTGRAVAAKAQRAKRAGAGVPKYIDPESGKTWTGFGKPPAWIAGAEDREAFRIGAAPSATTASKKAAAKRKRMGKGE